MFLKPLVLIDSIDFIEYHSNLIVHIVGFTKSRSKVHLKISSGKLTSTYNTRSISTVTSSFSSSNTSSSSISSTPSRYTSYRRISSTHIRHQAEAVLKFPSGDSRSSKVKNSPSSQRRSKKKLSTNQYY